MPTINKEHKDRLFSFLFGSESNREWTLSLYNGVNGTSYENPEDIQFTTIENAVYMGMKNDVSFVLFYVMNIYERQGVYNPNMPVRQLMYAAKLYDKYIQQKKLNETFKGNSYKQKTILKRLRTELNDTYQLRAPKQWKETFPENTAFKKADVIRIITEIATSN